ncbi:MAG: Trm112 family protein [Candidatus Acidiferrum sp.]
MAIPKEWLEIVACPVCKTPVKFTPDNSGLKCETCHRIYPIRDEIPMLVLEEGVVEKE